jgi:type I restriction enzyme, R subunit
LTRAFNQAMPRKEALDGWSDYQNFAEINELAYRHLHDGRISMKGIPPKLRGITDEYLRSQGISPKVAPISILDDDFQKDVQARKRSKTKAAAVEHAIRHFIDVNIDEDPELFSSFAQALEQILRDFKDNWDKIYEELEKLRQRIEAKEKEQTYGLDRKQQMPIFRIFKAELFGSRDLNEDEIAQNVDLTQNIFDVIQREVRSAGFWQSIPAQNRLKAELQQLLLSERFVIYPNILAKWQPLISRLMEWARENHATIVRD